MRGLPPRDLEYLLGRRVRRVLSATDRRSFRNRRVLVTGAGGSIGSELAHQIAACDPAQLVLLDQSEIGLFELERALLHAFPRLHLELALADVSRPGSMAYWCRTARPDVVYHAAAYKHVTMAERAVCAAAEANVLGAVCAADAAAEVGARFVLISTDKAAAPQSVMGATKRFAEIAVLSRAGQAFAPIVVRFGNVLGSSGSVLAIMLRHLDEGRPLPITDPDATRYFMTAGEAAALVMKTERLAAGPGTYWLDMGAPIRIGDLAQRLLRLAARDGRAQVSLDIVGLRPGEKLREELTNQGLRMCPTRHRRIWVARQRTADRPLVNRSLAALEQHVDAHDGQGVLDVLTTMVADFTPSPAARAHARAHGGNRRGVTRWPIGRTA